MINMDHLNLCRRMIIYPKGNNKDDGSGFISMYVEIDSTSLLTTSTTEVFTDLRFLYLTKKENKYVRACPLHI